MKNRSNVRDRSSPHQVVSDIETLVRNRLPGRVGDFRVEVRERGIVLRGYTRSYYAKQLVQHAALEVSKLPLVANEILVL